MNRHDPAAQMRTATDRARGDVRALVRRVAETVHGATVTHRAVPGYQVLTDTVLDDPLAGVRAADLVQRVAAGQVRDHADAARAAGRTWDEIADALGITDGSAARGELAYLLLVDHQPLPVDLPSFHRSSTWWRCTTCGQRVTDHGPYDPHPSDREEGHAPDCGRLAADLSAYRAGWEA